jgi:uncharacterized protein (DUF983 family)
MSGITCKCRECGKTYQFYAFIAGDQTVCPECRIKSQGDICVEKVKS